MSAISAALFRIARELGRQTILCATPEPERAQPLLPDTDVLVVNRGEAAALLSTSAEGRDLLQRLMHVGPSNVLLTLGQDGVAALIGEELVHQPAFEVDVVDTTGAGDAFIGALAASLAEGRSMTDALRRGLAAGACAVTKEGAQTSMPHRDAIEAMLQRADDTANAESD